MKPCNRAGLHRLLRCLLDKMTASAPGSRTGQDVPHPFRVNNHQENGTFGLRTATNSLYYVAKVARQIVAVIAIIKEVCLGNALP